MMTYDEVSASIDKAMSKNALLDYRLQMVLPSPMWRYNDNSGGVGTTQFCHPMHELVIIVLADAPLIRQPRKILQSHA